MTCEDITMSLGVYLLGALDAGERAEVEEHLRGCEVCRQELSELEVLPSMLARLTIDDIPREPLEVPDDLYERLAARARAEHAQRVPARVARYRRLTAVAAAVVLIAAASVGSLVVLRGGHHPPGTTVTATQGHVRMQVTLASQATGTGLAVTVSGLRRNEHCQLIAIAKDGTRDVAGRWDATYVGQAKQIGSTAIPRSQLSRLVLLGTGGTHLVTVSV
jgi:predicted anti-sigma-YlaC factor YlaD